jgi:replicative DNA helicase
LANILKSVSQEKIVLDSLKYIDDRRKGLIPSLKTKYTSLDSYTMNGFELNTMVTIAAPSGGGKSALAKEIRNSIHRLNKNLKFRHYCFNFELLAIHQIARTITSDKKMSLKKLYSVNEELKDVDYEELVKYSEFMRKLPINYFEVSGNPQQILNTIKHHYEQDCAKENITMIVEIDHLLLIRDDSNLGDKAKIDALMLGLIDLKKQISSSGGSVVFICLSQLNRDIKNKDRVFNEEGHYPITSDLMASSFIEQATDYMLVNNIPAKLNIQKYGVGGLPVYYTEVKKDYEKLKQFNYCHLLKNRSGEADIVFPMYNNLEYFALDEIKKEDFALYLDKFESTGKVTVNLK